LKNIKVERSRVDLSNAQSPQLQQIAASTVKETLKINVHTPSLNGTNYWKHIIDL